MHNNRRHRTATAAWSNCDTSTCVTHVRYMRVSSGWQLANASRIWGCVYSRDHDFTLKLLQKLAPQSKRTQAAQPWTATRSSQTPQSSPIVCCSENNRVSHKQGVLGWGIHVSTTDARLHSRVDPTSCPCCSACSRPRHTACLVKVLVSVAAKLISGVPVSATCIKSYCNARVAISHPCPQHAPLAPLHCDGRCVSAGQGQTVLGSD